MAKHGLGQFIIHKVFDPVLQAKAGAQSEAPAELRQLGLPTVNDSTEEVEEMAARRGH